jgi:hypothetical protein
MDANERHRMIAPRPTSPAAVLALCGCAIVLLLAGTDAVRAEDSLPQFRFLAPDRDAEGPGPWSFRVTPYYGSADMSNQDVDTSATWDSAGGTAVLTYDFDGINRVSLKGGYGWTGVDWDLRDQSLDVRSYAFGLQYDTALHAVHLGFGGSFSRNVFRSELQNDRDDWSGWEKEGHVSVYVPQNLGGEFWLTGLLGFHALELRQEAHDLGAAEFPAESRWSRAFFGGLSLELFEDQQSPGHVFKPWVFAGVSYETADKPLQGLSSFTGDQMAGNHFTVYSKHTSGVPDNFAGGLTGVFAAGLNAQISDAFFVGGFFYHEENADYDINLLGLNLDLKF